MNDDQAHNAGADKSGREQTEALLRDIRNLLTRCENTTRHDQALVAISACILGGIDTRKGIVEALDLLGFKKSHAAIILNAEAGGTTTGFPWRREPNGRYALNS